MSFFQAGKFQSIGSFPIFFKISLTFEKCPIQNFKKDKNKKPQEKNPPFDADKGDG